MDYPLGIRELENHHDLVCSLNNLERVWQIHRARHTRHIAFELWIAIQPVRRVLALSLGRPGLVRNLVSFDDSEAWWYPGHRSERDYGRRQNRSIRVHSRLRDQRP